VTGGPRLVDAADVAEGMTVSSGVRPAVIGAIG
jgi:hypothetical protein